MRDPGDEQLDFLHSRAPYQRHSLTSLESATAIESRLNALQRTVLNAIRVMGRATDEQIQHALAMNPSTERPRRVELVSRGLVRDSGQVALTQGRRKAVLWEAVP